MPFLIIMGLLYWFGSRGDDLRTLMNPLERILWLSPLLVIIIAGANWNFSEPIALMVVVPLAIGYWLRMRHLHRTSHGLSSD